MTGSIPDPRLEAALRAVGAHFQHDPEWYREGVAIALIAADAHDEASGVRRVTAQELAEQLELARQEERQRRTWPEIVVLCGSTRFKDAFRDAARSEALAGRIVLTVSDLDPRPEMRHVNVPIDADAKARLDWLHKRKIDLADRVLVLNVGGYIGESTRSEIDYAAAQGKPVNYLEAPAAESPVGGVS